jgi:integrase
LVLTGIRCGEALGLKWADIDLADSMLHVRRAIYRGQETTPKTPSALRDRPIVPELQQAMLHHKVMAVYRKSSDYVFASAGGRPLNPDLLRKALQSTLIRMGIHFEQPHTDGLHLLRHTSGSLLYRRSGGDLKTTQEWLAHSNSRITADVYVHTQSDQQRRAADMLSRAVFRQPESPLGESAN